MGGLLFNTQKRPNRTGADGVAADGSFDPLTDNYFNAAGWSDPGPLTFGNAPRADGTVRGFKVYNEDLTDLEDLRAAEGHEAAVRGGGRQHLQPDDLLRPEHELQLRPRSGRSTRSATSHAPFSLACDSTTDTSGSRVPVGAVASDVAPVPGASSGSRDGVASGRREASAVTKRSRGGRLPALVLAVVACAVLPPRAAPGSQAQAALQRAAALVEQGRLAGGGAAGPAGARRSGDASRGVLGARRDSPAAGPTRRGRPLAAGGHTAGAPSRRRSPEPGAGVRAPGQGRQGRTRLSPSPGARPGERGGADGPRPQRRPTRATTQSLELAKPVLAELKQSRTDS